MPLLRVSSAKLEAAASAAFAQWRVNDLLKPGTRTKRDGPLNFDGTLKGCWGLLRGHEDDDRLVEAPRHAGEGAAVVRVDDEEERPAGERVQIAGVKAAAEGKGKCGE